MLPGLTATLIAELIIVLKVSAKQHRFKYHGSVIY